MIISLLSANSLIDDSSLKSATICSAPTFAAGQFFVGSKSIFNKTPKINYTPQDVDNNHPPGLGEKLKVALQHLPKLGIKGILQGDMMFAKEDLAMKTIDGEQYVTFQPNTIVYAVPLKTQLAKEILNSKMGIVFHTEYTGNKMEDMKSSFNINIKQGDSFFIALEKTAVSRFRPILLTSLTTVAGLLPMISETSMQAQFLIPMATSIAFGVLFGTVFILFFISSTSSSISLIFS